MEFSSVLFAFLLTLIAGLSTGIGGAIPFFTKKLNIGFLCFSLGLSAGVMVYVSFMELFPSAITSLTGVFGIRKANFLALLFFFLGIFLLAIIDKLVPEEENPHEFGDRNASLHKVGIFSALAIAIHNFPEGLAPFMGALSDPMTGFSITIAIAIHNIPEGITVSAPIYYSTKSKWKAFRYAFFSGFAEPIGALLGFLFLRNFLNDTLFGLIYALVAGTMVYLSFDELLPTAENYGKHHMVIWGVIVGMLVMGLTIAFFA